MFYALFSFSKSRRHAIQQCNACSTQGDSRFQFKVSHQIRDSLNYCCFLTSFALLALLMEERSHYVKLALILSLRALFFCLFSETSCFDSVSVTAFDLSREQADDGYKPELPREHGIPFCSLHWPDSINITVIILTYQHNSHNKLSVPLFSYSLVDQPASIRSFASSSLPCVQVNHPQKCFPPFEFRSPRCH